MRCLTLRPHWAHAVAHLGKRIENRSRPIFRALVGHRVAIHAGATLPKGWATELDDAAPMVIEWDTERPACSVFDGRVEPGKALQPIVTRAIVATAILAGEARAVEDGPLFPDWAIVGHHWWILEDVHTLAHPIPVQRGQLGLWRLDTPTRAALAAMETI